MTLAALVLTLVALSPTEGSSEPVLLDFGADWCAPCRSMEPEIERLVKAGYPVKKINVDQSPELARRYKIGPIPAFVIVDGSGKEITRIIGSRPASEIAAQYRKVQAQLQAAANDRRADTRETEATPDTDTAPRSRGTPARTIPVSDRDEETEADTESEIRDRAPKTEIPKPWETGVRIKMHLPGGQMGFGSGTIVYSDADESIILTCAHIFKFTDRPTPAPKDFKARIDVDLFDGQLTSTSPPAVHYVETVAGKAIDYDFNNDVGLIRIRPGRRLPSSPIVGTAWKANPGQKMITVGCSEGHDATAWSTKITRPKAGLQHVNTKTGEVIPFSVIECEHAPRQGRSGGGLYTEEGYVAGVCDFADTNAKRGLYATPDSIYRILDRNNLTALYKPSTDDRMIARNDAPRSRPKTKALAQSPSESDRTEISLPDPKLMNIPDPRVAANGPEAKQASAGKGSRSWQTRSAVAVEHVAEPSANDRSRRPDPIEDEEDATTLRPKGSTRWRKLGQVPSGM